MKKMMFMAAALATLLLSACGSGDGSVESNVQAVAYTSDKGGRWGLVGSDGEVICAPRFDNAPSVVMHDRFVVREKDGYAIYTAAAEPERKGGGVYREIGAFVEEVAPAVEAGKAPVLVNIDGEVIADLSKLSGKTVIAVSNFREKRAVFMTADRRYGMINTTGQVVVEPSYLSLEACIGGYVVGVNDKFEAEVEAGEKAKITCTVMNHNGKEIGLLPYRKFSEIATRCGFSADRIPAADLEGRYGLVDRQGEWLLQPMAGVTAVTALRGEHFTFVKDGKTGLSNISGQVTLPARYADVRFLSDDRVMTQSAPGGSYTLSDLAGAQQGTQTFTQATPFFGSEGNALLEVQPGKWQLTDRGGSSVTAPAIAAVDWNMGCEWVTTDLFDPAVVMEHIALTRDGFIGQSLSMNPAAMLDFLRRHSADISMEAADNAELRTVSFDDTPSVFFAWSGTVTYDRSIVTEYTKESGKKGYMYNAEQPVSITGILQPAEMVADHLPALFTALTEQLRSYGSELAHTDTSLSVDCGRGVTTTVEMKNGKIHFAAHR